MATTEPQLHGLRPLSVLVAEDNPINALVVRTLLQREGHTVVHVTTGTGAVEASARQRFDLVLMNIQMPDLDGLEATRLIRTREGLAGERLPIYALTANAMRGDIDRCREAGMDDYLTKPLELAVLRRKLTLLSQHLTPSFPEAASPGDVRSPGSAEGAHHAQARATRH